jgi:hypothetical protein
MMATIVTAVFGTLLMGLCANPPFAIVPYMRENALVAHTVVQGLGYRWQTPWQPCSPPEQFSWSERFDSGSGWSMR